MVILLKFHEKCEKFIHRLILFNFDRNLLFLFGDLNHRLVLLFLARFGFFRIKHFIDIQVVFFHLFRKKGLRVLGPILYLGLKSRFNFLKVITELLSFFNGIIIYFFIFLLLFFYEFFFIQLDFISFINKLLSLSIQIMN